MTINGRSSEDLTAIEHSDPSDPWFHFYWPLPGEVQGVSWWIGDDRNNPAIIQQAGPTGVGIVAIPNPAYQPPPPPAPTGAVAVAPAINSPGNPGTSNGVTQTLQSLQNQGAGTQQPPAISGAPGVTGNVYTPVATVTLPPTTGGAAPASSATPGLPWYKQPFGELGIAAVVLWAVLSFFGGKH